MMFYENYAMKPEEVNQVIRKLLDPKDLGESIKNLMNQSYVDPRSLNDIRTRETRRIVGSEINPTEIKLDYSLSNEFKNNLMETESRRQAQIKAIEEMVIKFYQDRESKKDVILLLERLKHQSEEEARKMLAQEFEARYLEAMRFEALITAMISEQLQAQAALAEAFRSYDEKKSAFVEHINLSTERIVDQMRNFESDGFRVADHNSEEVMQEFARRYQYEAIKLEYEHELLQERRRQPHLENTQLNVEISGAPSVTPPPLTSYQIHQMTSKIDEHLKRYRDQREMLFDAVVASTGLYVKPEVKSVFAIQMEEWAAPSIKEGIDRYRELIAEISKVDQCALKVNKDVQSRVNSMVYKDSFDDYFGNQAEHPLQSKMS